MPSRVLTFFAVLGAVATAVAQPRPSRIPSLDGVWRSQGYGYIYQIAGSSLSAFEVTATTCVPGFTAERDGDAMQAAFVQVLDRASAGRSSS